MNFKSTWVYAALALCLGGGYGAGVAVSPSQKDVDAAIRTAEAAVRNCSQTDGDRMWKSGRTSNTPGKGF